MCPAFFLSCLDKRADLTYSKIRNGPANRRQYQKAGGAREAKAGKSGGWD